MSEELTIIPCKRKSVLDNCWAWRMWIPSYHGPNQTGISCPPSLSSSQSFSRRGQKPHLARQEYKEGKRRFAGFLHADEGPR